VGVGAVLMATPLHPIGHALALGGTGVLSTEFEAPKRALTYIYDRLAVPSFSFRRRKDNTNNDDDELIGEQVVEKTTLDGTKQKQDNVDIYHRFAVPSFSFHRRRNDDAQDKTNNDDDDELSGEQVVEKTTLDGTKQKRDDETKEMTPDE
jgi:hypothetical protein